MNDAEAVRCLLKYCPPENRPDVATTRTWYASIENYKDGYKTEMPGWKKVESSWEMAIRLGCQSEILRLILQNHPTIDVREVADKQKSSGNLNGLTAAIQVTYYHWKGELIDVDPEILETFIKNSLQEAFQEGNEKIVSLYIHYGWRIRTDDVLMINDPS